MVEVRKVQMDCSDMNPLMAVRAGGGDIGQIGVGTVLLYGSDEG